MIIVILHGEFSSGKYQLPFPYFSTFVFPFLCGGSWRFGGSHIRHVLHGHREEVRGDYVFYVYTSTMYVLFGGKVPNMNSAALAYQLCVCARAHVCVCVCVTSL